MAFLTSELAGPLGATPECLEVAVAPGHRAVEVVREVRAVVGGGVAVLVTWAG